ncbi:MAG: hypothetical protein GY856_33285 [bacterium]|nr:hypothetical protein [bacterium]
MTNEIRLDELDHLDLNSTEYDVFAQFDRSLTDSLEVFKWWLKTDREKTYRDKYDLMRQPASAGTNFGFLDVVPLSRGLLPVAGVIQDMFYDRSKGVEGTSRETAEWMRDQVKEFVLHYFMRACSSRKAQIHVPPAERGTRSGPFSEFSMCPDPGAEKIGIGYKQLFYKEKKSGRLGRFPEAERKRIVDLRTIDHRDTKEAKYDWIMATVDIFDFGLAMQLGSFEGPELFLPVEETVFAILHPDFLVYEDDPAPGVLGEYGYGYAFIPSPELDSVFAYGPERLTSAFEYIHFRVLDNGEVWVKMAFVANYPRRILINASSLAELGLKVADGMSLGTASKVFRPMLAALNRTPLRYFQPAPVFASIDLLNFATAGLTGDLLAINRERLIKDVMSAHFLMLYDFILDSLPTFKKVPNWLDRKKLPSWVVTGESSA